MPIDYQPVWRPDAVSKASRFFFYSPTLGRRACLGKKLHFHRSLQLEGEDAQSYCEYPLEISARIAGRFTRTLVHFWVRYRDGSEGFESLSYHNPEDRSGSELAALAAKQLWCDQNEFRHRVLTRHQVRANIIRLGNWGRIIGSYDAGNFTGRAPQIGAASNALLQVVKAARRISVGAALSEVSRKHLVSDTRLGLYELLRAQAIDGELSKWPFDAQSNLTLL